MVGCYKVSVKSGVIVGRGPREGFAHTTEMYACTCTPEMSRPNSGTGQRGVRQSYEPNAIKTAIMITYRGAPCKGKIHRFLFCFFRYIAKSTQRGLLLQCANRQQTHIFYQRNTLVAQPFFYHEDIRAHYPLVETNEPGD